MDLHDNTLCNGWSFSGLCSWIEQSTLRASILTSRHNCNLTGKTLLPGQEAEQKGTSINSTKDRQPLNGHYVPHPRRNMPLEIDYCQRARDSGLRQKALENFSKALSC